MTTISNALLNNTGSAASTLAGLNTPQSTTSAANTAQRVQGAVQGQTVFTPSVVNPLASLTYTSAGKLPSVPQTQASAQAAYVAAQNAITQSMSDLMSGSTSGSSGSSSTDIFGASTSSAPNDPTGLLTNLPSSLSSGTASVATDTKVQVAQKAYMATQAVVTQAQGALIK